MPLNVRHTIILRTNKKEENTANWTIPCHSLLKTHPSFRYVKTGRKNMSHIINKLCNIILIFHLRKLRLKKSDSSKITYMENGKARAHIHPFRSKMHVFPILTGGTVPYITGSTIHFSVDYFKYPKWYICWSPDSALHSALRRPRSYEIRALPSRNFPSIWWFKKDT